MTTKEKQERYEKAAAEMLEAFTVLGRAVRVVEKAIDAFSLAVADLNVEPKEELCETCGGQGLIAGGSPEKPVAVTCPECKGAKTV